MSRKLLFVVNVDWFFISHRLPIAITAIEQGYQVHVACGITSKKNYLEELGINVHPLPLSRSGMTITSEIISLKEIYKIIKLISPDVLHMVTIKPVVYASLISRFMNIEKRVASISGLGFVFTSNSIKAKLLKGAVTLLYRLGLNTKNTSVIFQNTEDQGLFLKNKIITSSQAILIRGSGVDLSKFTVKPEPSAPFVVMFLARFLKDKGINEFVDAARHIRKCKKNIRFVLVGDIDLHNPNSITKSELESYIDEGVVECWGFNRDVGTVIAKSNIIVLPSYREGLPKSLIEAAACGRAVITTDVAGCRDAIEPLKTGLLVLPRDVDSLIVAINFLMEDQDLRNKYACAGRDLAERSFNIRDVVNTHLKIYRGDI